MDESLFVLLLLSGLFWISSALSRQYHYINLTLSWPEAQSYCRERFTDLATVDNMADVNRLVNIINAAYSGSVWIGLKRATQRRWVWSNGEDTLAQYSNWGPGEPAIGQDCAFSNRLWLTAKCSDLKGALCSDKWDQYRVTLLQLNWTDAQGYCREHFIDLVTIRNFDNKTNANSKTKDFGPLWIGLFRDPWEWSDNWSSFFKYWAAGQPSQSTGSGDCVSMSRTDSGKWAPESCDLQKPFIFYGDEKFMRKQTVRLKLSCSGTCTLNDPSLQTTILNQITERLKSMGLEGESKVSWVKSKDEEVFHQEGNSTAN